MTQLPKLHSYTVPSAFTSVPSGYSVLFQKHTRFAASMTTVDYCSISFITGEFFSAAFCGSTAVTLAIGHRGGLPVLRICGFAGSG